MSKSKRTHDQTGEKKVAVPLLSKPRKGEKTYTKSKLIAHISAAVTERGLGDLSRKQTAAFLDEFAAIVRSYAPVGATVPGIGKILVKEIPARPARTIISFGREIQAKAKPKSQKIVFRFTKQTRDYFRHGG